MRKLLLGTLYAALTLLVCIEVQAQEDRFVVFGHGKHGYIDREGKLFIPISLEGTYVLNFSEGFVSFAERVQPEPRKVPYVDRDGKLRIYPQEKWGFIDTAGAVLIGAQFDAVREFSEGLAAVAYDTDQTNHGCLHCNLNQKWGFIDKSGNTVVPQQFHAALSFSGGLAAVMNDKSKWGYINTKGDVVIPFSFDHARPFSEGLAPVAIKKLFGYINRDGHFVISPQYTVAGAFSGGLAAVRTGGTTENMYMRPAMRSPGGTWAFIGADGSKKINLPKTTVEARDFAEGLAAIYLADNRCGYVNVSGSMVVSPIFSYCEDFSEGLAFVLATKLKYIDKEGRSVLDTSYDNGRSFKNGLASVEEGISGPEQKVGYINKQGKEVWKPQPAL